MSADDPSRQIKRVYPTTLRSAGSVIVFETPRLVVREYVPADAEFVLDMYSRDEVSRFLPSQRPRTIDEAGQRIGRFRRLYASHPQGAWALTLRGTAPIIGTVILMRAPLSVTATPPTDDVPGRSPEPMLTEDFEVGWHLHPDHWGHGYAAEAAAGALRRAFDAGILQVIALMDPDNTRSRRVALSLGMQHVGVTDRYHSLRLDLFRIVRPGNGRPLGGNT